MHLRRIRDAQLRGTTITPLGYDTQYTSTDTGLIYLRARTYDPATDQFLSVDPAGAITRAPYNYAGDNPVNSGDPTGLGNWLGLGIPSPGEVVHVGLEVVSHIVVLPLTIPEATGFGGRCPARLDQEPYREQ